MTVSYAFWCSRRDARVMGSNSARSICRYYPAGTPPCPPYMPGCNTKIRQAKFDSYVPPATPRDDNRNGLHPSNGLISVANYGPPNGTVHLATTA